MFHLNVSEQTISPKNGRGVIVSGNYPVMSEHTHALAYLHTSESTAVKIYITDIGMDFEHGDQV